MVSTTKHDSDHSAKVPPLICAFHAQLDRHYNQLHRSWVLHSRAAMNICQSNQDITTSNPLWGFSCKQTMPVLGLCLQLISSTSANMLITSNKKLYLYLSFIQTASIRDGFQLVNSPPRCCCWSRSPHLSGGYTSPQPRAGATGTDPRLTLGRC